MLKMSHKVCWKFEPQLAQTRLWYTLLFHSMANPIINLPLGDGLYYPFSILWLFWWFYRFFGLPRCQFVALRFCSAKLRAGFWPRLRVRKLPIISWNFACQWRCKAQMIFDVRWRQSKQRQKTTRGTRFKISCSGCGSKLEFFEVEAAVPFENCWARGMVNRHRRKSKELQSINPIEDAIVKSGSLSPSGEILWLRNANRIYIARLPLNPMVDHQPYP